MRNRNWLAMVVMAGLFALVLSAPAVAEDKGVIALQQSVSLLLNQVNDLQKSLNTQMGLIQGMVTQNTDAVSKLSGTLASIQHALNGNQVVASQQQNSEAQQFQALADQIADLKARLQQITTTLQQVHQMQQTIPAPAPLAAPGAAGAAGPDAGAGPGASAGSAPDASAGPAASPASQIYQNALTDFQKGSPRAQTELAGFIRSYPTDPEVPDATYYLGTLYLQKQQYNEAIDFFSDLIEQYPDNAKTPLAELNKGIALSKRGDKPAAISELRALAANYPGTEAARLADSELRGLGATTPSTARKRR
ncbi:MAG TPA: tetratricopeptide repeat protein [Terriglobales bacterium]|jgi:tol-pal system protein YbgF